MKYAILFILILLLVLSKGWACSCGFSTPFCSYTASTEIDLVVSGKIVSVDSTKLRLKIIDIFKGIEEKDTITIWAGTDGMCSPMFVSMSTIQLGKKGDSIIINLPRISSETIENGWDIIGYYRRPAWLCEDPVLNLKNDSVFGNIEDSGVARPYWSVNKLPYADFKNLWNNQTINCLSLRKTDNHEIYNPDICWDQDNLIIENPENLNLSIDIYNPAGRKLRSLKSDSNRTITLDLFMEDHKFLIVQITDKEEIMITKKVLR